MCNHYRNRQDIVAHALRIIQGLELTDPDLGLKITEHVYPKYPAPVVVQQAGVRSLVSKAWGVPITIKGAKGQPIVKPVTNARNDKLSGYTWRYATAERRCLIPAVGYFEPGLGPVGAKGEILFSVKERPAFFFAGLWEGDAFTMVTTTPNEFVSKFHDRMPVVLEDAEALDWLGEAPLPPDRLTALCRGLPSEALDFQELPPKLKITRPAKKEPETPPGETLPLL